MTAATITAVVRSVERPADKYTEYATIDLHARQVPDAPVTQLGEWVVALWCLEHVVGKVAAGDSFDLAFTPTDRTGG